LAARLRRLCEKKRGKNGGKLKVPEAIHQAYMEAADKPERRDKMMEVLAACDFDKH
jgi:hypothetical protein